MENNTNRKIFIKSLNKEIEFNFDIKSLQLLKRESKKIRTQLVNNGKSMAKEIDQYNNQIIKTNEKYNPEKIQEIVIANNDKRETNIKDLNVLIQSIDLIEKHIKEINSQAEKQKEIIAENKKVDDIKLWIDSNRELLAKSILKSKELNKGLSNNSIIKALRELKINNNK